MGGEREQFQLDEGGSFRGMIEKTREQIPMDVSRTPFSPSASSRRHYPVRKVHVSFLPLLGTLYRKANGGNDPF
jgi:hypothetical protein